MYKLSTLFIDFLNEGKFEDAQASHPDMSDDLASMKLIEALVDEQVSAEFSQDMTSYFGTNDSIDGPYKELSPNQPFNDDKQFLKKLRIKKSRKTKF